MTFELQTNVLHQDEVFLRVKILGKDLRNKKDSKFYVHDSLNHVRKDIIKKRVLTSRDLASKYYAGTSGTSYRYKEEKNDFLFSFFTGSRANSFGYLKDG